MYFLWKYLNKLLLLMLHCSVMIEFKITKVVCGKTSKSSFVWSCLDKVRKLLSGKKVLLGNCCCFKPE